MPKKPKKADEPAKSAEQQALEERVDAMMSTELPVQKADPADPAKPTSHLKIVSAYKAPQKTAPALPAKLLKEVETDDGEEPQPAAEPEPDPEPEPEADTKPEPAEEAPAEDQPPAKQADSDDLLEDSETDKAVDDIVAHEGDTQLAVDDAVAEQRTAATAKENQQGWLAWLFTSFWTWLIIIGTAAVLYLWFR